jgi:hypothetical protein
MSPYLLAFVLVLAATSSVIVHTTAEPSKTEDLVERHTCSSIDSKTIEGKIRVKSVFRKKLIGHRDAISEILASYVQSSPSNSESQVFVHTMTELDNGDAIIEYTCSEVRDHTSAKHALHEASKSDIFKEIVEECERSHHHQSETVHEKSAEKQEIEDQLARTSGEEHKPSHWRDSSSSEDVPSKRDHSRHHISRIVTTTSDVTYKHDVYSQSQCGQCAASYIFASFLVEDVTPEQISHQFHEKIRRHLKELLTNEIEKQHPKGLKSIEITSLNAHHHDSLIVEFVAVVKPKHHQQIVHAIRTALLSINFDQTFNHKNKY